MLVVARKASRRSGQFTSRLVTAKVIGICAVYAAIARSYYYSDLGRSVMYVHALVSSLLLPSKKLNSDVLLVSNHLHRLHLWSQETPSYAVPPTADWG